MQFTLVALVLDLCVMTYLSQIGTDVVLLLPPHLPYVVHYPHPLYILSLLFVHILLFSLSSYFVCRLTHRSCCWSLYCDIYKSQLSILAAHLQVYTEGWLHCLVSWKYNYVCQPGCFVLACYRQKTASANTLWHCHPRMPKRLATDHLKGILRYL